MGKWDGFKDKYPALPDDPKRADALRKVLDERREQPIAEIVAAHDAADARRAELEDQISQATLERDACRILMRGYCETTKQQRLTIDGFNYTPSSEPYPVVIDKAAFMEHARTAAPELLSYAHGTLKTVIKSALEGKDGFSVPPGVDVFMAPTFSRTKAAK